MSFSAAFRTILSMFERAYVSSISRPSAVGLIEMLASIPLSTIVSITDSYSLMNHDDSSIELISSPRTSMVKQAPSDESFLIKSSACSRLSPAVYLFATHPTTNFGAKGSKVTMLLPKRPMRSTAWLET